MEMGERDPEHESSLGSGKNFVSVTEDDDDVGGKFGECSGESRCHLSERFSDG
jgi:hypothetical protein